MIFLVCLQCGTYITIPNDHPQSPTKEKKFKKKHLGHALILKFKKEDLNGYNEDITI